jgi:hypothetical protein
MVLQNAKCQKQATREDVQSDIPTDAAILECVDCYKKMKLKKNVKVIKTTYNLLLRETIHIFSTHQQTKTEQRRVQPSSRH